MNKEGTQTNMLRAIYIGEKSSIGRFGIVKKGDELRMMFHEVLAVVAHRPERWRVIDEVVRVEDGHDVLPYGNKHFDLRTLNYFDFERLFPALERTAPMRLNDIARAINYVGGYVCLHRDITKTELVDSICFNAWRFSWDQLSSDECHVLPEIDIERSMWENRSAEKPKTEPTVKRTRKRSRGRATKTTS
jgi:hypothetical protein